MIGDIYIAYGTHIHEVDFESCSVTIYKMLNIDYSGFGEFTESIEEYGLSFAVIGPVRKITNEDILREIINDIIDKYFDNVAVLVTFDSFKSIESYLRTNACDFREVYVNNGKYYMVVPFNMFPTYIEYGKLDSTESCKLDTYANVTESMRKMLEV
jgi:hypothetical protein